MARRKAPRVPDALLDQLLAGADPKTAFEANGLGCHVALADGLRDSLWAALSQAADGDEARLDLVHLRGASPGLRGEGVHVLYVHHLDRVLVVHRWVEGEGRDLVVVASLNDATLHGYMIEMPWPGLGCEVFNSDLHDHFPSPWVTGNGGAVLADGAAGRDPPSPRGCTSRRTTP